MNDIDAFEAATSEPLYRIKGFNSLVFDKNGLDKLEKSKESLFIPYSEAYKKVMNDTWDIARELCKTGYSECTEMFGNETVEHVIKNFTPLEIKEKIESFKKEIKVGDVVTVGDGDITFICTKDNSNGDYTKCHLVAGDGSVYEDCDKFDCQKTGKSIDIGEILKEIEQIVNECDGYDGNSTFLALQLIKDLDRLRKCISIDVHIE